MNFAEAHYDVIWLPGTSPATPGAFADGNPVLLAVRRTDAVVVAITPDRARELWQLGKLSGWTPNT